MNGAVSEFLEVVRKNLGASDVRVLAEGESAPPSEGVIVCELPFGQLLAVSFAGAQPDPHAAQRKLEILVRAFESTLRAAGFSAPGSVPRARALQTELTALVERAAALDAVVIDAHSPAIWGGTYGELPEILEPYEPPREPDNVYRIDGQPHSPRASELVALGRSLGVRVFEALAIDPRAQALIPRETCEKHVMVPLFGSGSALLLAMADPTDIEGIYEAALASGLEVEPALAPERLVRFILAWKSSGFSRNSSLPKADLDAEQAAVRETFAAEVRKRWMRHFATRKAIELVRSMPEIQTLHRGGHLNRTVIESDFACVARSFAAIYVLVVVFEGPFDELRAKHAISQALPIVEALVLALPPRDPPTSTAGARAVRRSY